MFKAIQYQYYIYGKKLSFNLSGVKQNVWDKKNNLLFPLYSIACKSFVRIHCTEIVSEWGIIKRAKEIILS